jgi:DnaJ-class molecular chaperone
MDSSDDEVGGGSGSAFGGPGRSFRQAAAPSAVVVEQPLPVSLEELATGFTKKLKVTKRIQDSVTGAIKTVANVLEVTGKPGWKAGTKITFPAAGDELTGQPQQDICFVVQQRPHPHFTRNGDDLVTTVRVPLVDALCGATVQVPLLDGQSQRLSLDRIAPDTVRQIAGQGMPNKDGGRGNLVVKFQIVFPTQLTPEHKEGLRNFLPRS